jgi:uncharacterized membrane-anchored protein
MNSRVDEALLRHAIAEQILPATACVAAARAVPWPLGVLAMLGGWLAAVPLVIWFFLTVPGMLEYSALALSVGAAVLLFGIRLLNHYRHRPLLMLVSVPLFFCGELIIGAALVLSQGEQIAMATMAAVALGCAWYCPQPFLRLGLGVQLAVLGLLLFSLTWRHGAGGSRWLLLHLQLAAWGGLHAFRRSVLNTALDSEHAELAESLSAGWIGTIIVAMALAAKPDWLLHSVTGVGLNRLLYGTDYLEGVAAGEGVISCVLAVAAACWLRAKWPNMRNIPAALACCVLAILAGFVPTLGGLLLILALSAASARWRTASLAAVAGVVTLVSFYQGWDWTLAMKALLLGTLGAILLVAGMTGMSQRAITALALPLPDKRRAWRPQLALPLASAVLMLVSVNWQIWQQEDLLARGRSVYFEIGPVDPRSLMQGDYMAISFPALAPVVRGCRDHPVCDVVVKLDKRGVVISARQQDQLRPAADELAVRLTVRNGQLEPGSSEWFFAEGEAQRWAKARYAQFRILPDGRSALSQLHGPQLEKL